jgi:hypothetical protein
MEENQVQIFADAHFSPKIFKKATFSAEISRSRSPNEWG